MTKRNTTDQLLRAFLDTYKINLLAVPRENADIGDAYVQTKQGISVPGRLQGLLTPEIAMPKIERKEKISGISGKQTRALELNAALKLLDGFFSVIGAGSVVGSIKAEAQRKQATLFRFKLKDPTRDYVDPYEFGKALIPCHLDTQQPFVAQGNRYYVTVGVVRSRSITVSAEDESSNVIGLNGEAIQSAISTDGKLAVSRELNDDLTYEGTTPLAFGVELVELKYNDESKKFFITGMQEPIDIRAPGEIEKAFIGDPNEGDVFIYPLLT